MLNITMIGCGAIGVAVLELLENDPQLRVEQVIASAGSEALVQQRLASFKRPPQVLTALPAEARPDLLVECAGHLAIEEHVLPALERGIACLIVSVGALSEPGLVERLEAAAARGNTRIELLPAPSVASMRCRRPRSAAWIRSITPDANRLGPGRTLPPSRSATWKRSAKPR
jgi:aspartate dehydrogenase